MRIISLETDSLRGLTTKIRKHRVAGADADRVNVVLTDGGPGVNPGEAVEEVAAAEANFDTDIRVL